MVGWQQEQLDALRVETGDVRVCAAVGELAARAARRSTSRDVPRESAAVALRVSQQEQLDALRVETQPAGVHVMCRCGRSKSSSTLYESRLAAQAAARAGDAAAARAARRSTSRDKTCRANAKSSSYAQQEQLDALRVETASREDAAGCAMHRSKSSSTLYESRLHMLDAGVTGLSSQQEQLDALRVETR